MGLEGADMVARYVCVGRGGGGGQSGALVVVGVAGEGRDETKQQSCTVDLSFDGWTMVVVLCGPARVVRRLRRDQHASGYKLAPRDGGGVDLLPY